MLAVVRAVCPDDSNAVKIVVFHIAFQCLADLLAAATAALFACADVDDG